MSTFRPSQPPADPKAVAMWAAREFAAIKAAMERADPHLTWEYLHAEPSKITAGMVVIADGSDWNPSDGVGFYRRNETNTAWVFLEAASAMLAIASLSTSTSTGLSTATSSIVSLSTSTSSGLSTANSRITSLSTSASSGLSTATSSIVSLSTSTSSTLSTHTSQITSLSSGVSSANSSITSLSTSTSSGLSTATSSIVSLSTSTSSTLSTHTSQITSLSTGLSTTNSNVTSLSTSTSTGLSTATSSIVSLSTSTSTAIALKAPIASPSFTGTVTSAGLVDLSGASAGQIKFPATRNASADANTFDDYQEGTFTGTGTGFTTSPTGTCTYTLIGNTVSMELPFISATSNATTFTITGMPAEARPANTKTIGGIRVMDNGTLAFGFIQIASTGTITVFKDAPGTNWTNAGTKRIDNCSISYLLT